MTTHKIVSDKIPLWDSLEFIRGSNTRLMNAVLDFIESHKVTLTSASHDSGIPLVSNDPHTVITPSVKEGMSHYDIAAQIAKGAKLLSQRANKDSLFLWDALKQDIDASEDVHHLNAAYRLSPVADTVLLQLISAVDAEAYAQMAVRELRRQSVDQNDNTHVHAKILSDRNWLDKAVNREFNYMSGALTQLSKLGTEEIVRKKPRVSEQFLPINDITSIAAPLWQSPQRRGIPLPYVLRSPLIFSQDIRTSLTELHQHIAGQSKVQEIRRQIRANFRFGTIRKPKF